MPYDLQLSAELGLISDRNFVEEYFKREWDELKDETTGLELKQYNENRSWSVTADYRVNDFFTDTNWLPRADHFMLGQSLFGNVFTWHEHSSAAYAQFRPTTVPANATPFPSPPNPVARPDRSTICRGNNSRPRAPGCRRGKSSIGRSNLAPSRSCRSRWAMRLTGARIKRATR